MTPPIPTCEPDSFAAGETVTWSRQSADYPPSAGWSLVYYFRGASAFNVTAAAQADGTYLATINSADTSAKTPGTYPWRSFFVTGTDPNAAGYQRIADREGVLVLAPNFQAEGPTDGVVFAEQMVAAIEARLADRAGADLESYSVAGKQAMKIPFEKLNAALGVWKAKLYRLRTGTSFVSHPVRFHAPGR